MDVLIKLGTYFFTVVFLAFLVSKYIKKIYLEENTFISKFFSPIEKKIYHLLKIEESKQMGAKEYFLSILGISLVSIVLLMLILLLGAYLPWTSKVEKPMSLSLAFHTAISYVTNTNFQSYLGEEAVNGFIQQIGLTVQNFISAGVGIAVLFALIRGITNKEKKEIGNFWRDLTKIILELLLPLSLGVAVLLVVFGVPQNFKEQEIQIVTEQGEETVKAGAVASQVAIKQLGSNGGGYIGSNAASEVENPNPITNFIEMVCILLIPMALVFMFGDVVKEKRQGYGIFVVMFCFLIVGVSLIIGVEGYYQNWEGKENRIGIVDSSIWSALTTATSNGSTNSNLEGYHPISKVVFLFQMAVGEVIFGGVGSGLYTMLAFVLLTVFIAGLMIGKSPQYLGKKIEAKEMRMVLLILLTTPFMVLITSSFSMVAGNLVNLLGESSSKGFTEVLYNFLSSGANNGSSLKGMVTNTTFLNFVLGITMLVGRFIPMYGVVQLAESLGAKKIQPSNKGELRTTTPVFLTLLAVVIIVIGALGFLPSVALGPIVDIFR